MKRRDRGDSLIEVLIAMFLVAVIVTFGGRDLLAMLNSSQTNAAVTKVNLALANEIQLLQSTIDGEPNSLYISCGTVGQYSNELPQLTTLSQVSAKIVSVAYESTDTGTPTFVPTCTGLQFASQQITVSATYIPTGYSQTASVVVSSSSEPVVPSQMVWINEPPTSLSRSGFMAPLQLAIEDPNGEVVTSDNSVVTINACATSVSGTTTTTVAASCSVALSFTQKAANGALQINSLASLPPGTYFLQATYPKTGVQPAVSTVFSLS